MQLGIVRFLINNLQISKNEHQHLVFPFVKTRKYRNFQILIYHRIDDNNDFFLDSMPTHVFENQMRYLSMHFNIYPLEEMIERMKAKDVPDNAIVITFDDGYRDVYTHALPILKKYSIPATIFLTTDAIDSRRILWHDMVFSAFKRTTALSLKDFGHDTKTYSLTTSEARLFAEREVLQFLKSLDQQTRMSWISYLTDQLQVVGIKEMPSLMMTWNEIKLMHQEGISFGSHTHTHPILSKISSYEVYKEVHDSKQLIEAKLGIPANCFAYPNGKMDDFNETTKSLLKEAGYTCALTTIFGSNEYYQDCFELRRGTPWDDNLHQFGMRLCYHKL